MSKHPKTYKAILAEVAQPGHRSSLFWFLVEHHDNLIAQADGKRMHWDALCARFAEHGLTDILGKPATPRTARETWLQARRTVAEARARKQAQDATARPGQTFPSRISPDWRPAVVPPPPPVRAEPTPTGSSTPSAASRDPRAPSRDPDMTPEGQAVLDKAWEALLAADRKKFGF
jgi:hypothetical protein